MWSKECNECFDLCELFTYFPSSWPDIVCLSIYLSLYIYIGREHHEMNILLFHELLDHVARVDRVLTSPGGSLLLSGRSGVGRSSAVSLVAHMHQIDIVTPHISRSYSLKHFKNDLKNVRNVWCVANMHMISSIFHDTL